MYKTANEYYKQKFGCKVYKLSIDGSFTCPNRDGTKGHGGCIFCSASGSGDFAEKGDNIVGQLQAAKKRVEGKNKSGKYIAYFQAFTNTYAPVEKLKSIFYEAIKPDYIVGLSIGTRPDCLPNETIELLKEINAIKPVSVELGLQTTNEKSAEYIRRGYRNEVYFDAVKRLKAAGIEVVTHIIIGLPFETADDAVKTTCDAVAAGSDGVKYHLLHVLKNTDLEKEYLSGKFECLTLLEYAEILKECIAVLPPDTVVHRITGDGSKRDLVAPLWSADKKTVLNFLNKPFKRGIMVRENKNTLLIIGIFIYEIYAVYDNLFRIPHAYSFKVQPSFKYVVLCAIFSAIAYMILPMILLMLNLKQKTKNFFAVIVAIFSIISTIMVAIKFSSVLSYLIISKLDLLDTYWQYLFFEILPKRGLVGIISFILITIGAILSIKKQKTGEQ